MITYKLIYYNLGNNKTDIPLTFYEESEKSWKSYTSIKSVEVYCNGQQLSKNLYHASQYAETASTKISYGFLYAEVTVYNIPKGVNNIVIKYTYKSEDVIQQFNNATVLRLKNNTVDFTKTNYNITLPKSSNLFETNSKKIEVSKNINGQYVLGITENLSDKYIELKIDKGIIKQGKLINEDIETYEFLKLFSNDKTENFIILGILGIITVIFFIVVIILTRKIKVTEYVRNPEMLLDPIVAESIIDRKIGAKELIMSCIAELIYRKKLRNIGNDAVEIVDLNQISEYEKEIVELMFNGKNKITFEEIKKIFLKEAEETKTFYEKFKKIKQRIEEKIYDYNVYSRMGDKVLKTIKIFSFLILICIGYLLANTLYDYTFIEYGRFAGVIFVFLVMTQSSKFKEKFTNIQLKRGNGLRIFIDGIIIFVLTTISIVLSIRSHLIMLLGIIAIAIINIIIIRKTNLHVFTEYGKQEYAKVVGLKNYIVDYSLMQQRELDSAIIWDEYLAYSVAFGISNKVSRKFSENLMEANIVIQRIDKFLRM